MWIQQQRKCALCGRDLDLSEAVLDHCHETGRVRGVLHRQCNQVEGRVISWVKRSGCGTDPSSVRVFIENILAYWDLDFSQNPLHPNHRTESEKEILKLKRRMKKLKTQKAKQRYKQKIEELRLLAEEELRATGQ
jgi:hypothetical protein